MQHQHRHHKKLSLFCEKKALFGDKTQKEQLKA